MECANVDSASVKFFGGPFNILNDNKRLVVIIENEATKTRVALVIVGGVGVNTISYNQQLLGNKIQKGQELSAFRAGGRYVIFFLHYDFVAAL